MPRFRSVILAASMSVPTKKLEELLLNLKIVHTAHPLLGWMASNVSIETDAAYNWKPSKKKSVERIYGIVTLIMAIDRATCAAPSVESGLMLL